MKRLLNLFFCLSAVMMLSAPQFAAAQTAEVTVSGKVSDQNGLPIIGAGVVLSSDSSKGTTTDLDGNYTITVPANSTLNFSCIGYGDEAVQGQKDRQVYIFDHPDAGAQPPDQKDV